MRNILFNYHRASPIKNFYKISQFIGVSIEKLFEGISKKAKKLFIKFQSPLPEELVKIFE